MPRLKQEEVGEAVRRLREAQGLSLRALAAATEFSPSFISQLERGEVSPSIGSMERIVRALGLSLGDFFANLGSSESGLIVRAADRVELNSQWSHGTVDALSPMRRGRLLEPLLITLAPAGRSGKHPSGQPREEFAYILEGEVELTLGPDVYRLQAGDAATILRGELRRWVNVGTGPAQILIVATN